MMREYRKRHSIEVKNRDAGRYAAKKGNPLAWAEMIDKQRKRANRRRQKTTVAENDRSRCIGHYARFIASLTPDELVAWREKRRVRATAENRKRQKNKAAKEASIIARTLENKASHE